MTDEQYDLHLAGDPQASAELRRLFRPENVRVVFDIGACEGEDSLRYARLFPRARVFAFEPLPMNQELIRHHFSRHGASRCELVPIALSDRAGTADFHVSSGTPSEKFAGEDWNYGNKSSSLLPPAGEEPMFGWIRFEETLRTQTDTLDSFCARRGIGNIDFIHLDVQGAESLVLRGAARMLPQVTAIWLEVSNRRLYAGQALRAEIESLMRAAGFVLTRQDMREIEGDQFYVNLRKLPAWRYVSGRLVRNAARRVRKTLGLARRVARPAR